MKTANNDYTADFSDKSYYMSIHNKRWIYILTYNKEINSLGIPPNKVNRLLPEDRFFVGKNDDLIRFCAKDSANYDAQTYYAYNKRDIKWNLI